MPFTRSHQFGAILISILFLAACDGKPVISGQVKDNFSKPVQGASIQIGDSAFETSTDSDGHYELPFVPGTFVVAYSKEGYSSETVILSIDSKSAYPMREVVLYRMPPGDEIYLQGADDYIPLAPAAVSSTKDGDYWQPTFHYHLATTPETSSQLQSLQQEIARLPDSGIVFFDSYPENMKLVSVKDGFIGQTIAGIMGKETTVTDIDEELRRIESTRERRTQLAPDAITAGGQYCYVQTHTSMTGSTLLTGKQSRAFCLGTGKDN